MRDVEAVESIIAGNSGGLADAYDEYADFIYAYCRSMLGDPKQTAETVVATFVVAAARADGLRDREHLRAWLFAIARSICRRGRGGAGHTPVPRPRASQDDIEIGTDEERLLLRAAIDGLNPPEHDIVSLLWYGLDIDDVALVLGVPRNHVYSVFSRARDQLEASVAALLVGRRGRDDCHALDSLLDDWDGSLDSRLQARITRHIAKCGACSARRERELRPALQLSLSPGALLSAAEEARASIPSAPRRIRDRLIWLVTAYDPDAAAERAAMEKRAGSFGGTGFPKPRAARGGRRPSPLVTGGAVLAVAAAVVLAFAFSSGGGAPSTAAAAKSPHATASAAVASASVVSPSSGTPASPGHDPAVVSQGNGPRASTTPGSRTGTKTSPASTSPSVSVSVSSPAPGRTSASPPAASRGTLTASPSSITVVAPFSTTVTVTASGGTVNWSASLPSSVSGEITVSPSSGTLPAGQSVSLSVTSHTASSFKTTLTVNPGGHAIAVTVGIG